MVAVRLKYLQRRIDIVSLALLTLVIARALVACLSTPIAAYANNYDFVRQSSCVGVWQDYGGKEKTLNNPERPVNNLIVDGDVRPEVCLRSSDNIVPWLVAHLAGRGAHIELREIGFVKIVILEGLLLSIFAQPIYPIARLAFMVSAYALLGDIAVLSYFDTLYLDASAIMFCFASIVFAVAVWCRTRPPNTATLGTLLFVVAWLTCSKQQYAPYAAFICLVGLFGFLRRWRSKGLAITGLAGLVMIQALYFGAFSSSNEHTRQIRKANLSDTFLEAVLPAAPDKPKALSILGLPQTCMPAIGLNWYHPPIENGELCPEVFLLHRSSLIRLFTAFPQTFVLPMLHAATYNRPFYLSIIGHFERPADVDRLRFRFLFLTSLSTWLDAIPDNIYLIYVIGLTLLGAISFVVILRRQIHRDYVSSASDTQWLLYGCSGTLAFYAVGSAVFGDGYGDLQRHCVGIFIATACAIGGLVFTFGLGRRKTADRPAYVVSLPGRRIDKPT